MKQVLLFCLSLFALNIFAQNVEGVITFEQKINLHKRIDNEEMKAYVPEFQVSNMQLFMKGQTSVYKELENPADEVPQMEGGMKISLRSSSGGEIHKNLGDNTYFEKKSFMGREFLIEGDLKKKAWKMGAASKEILGYTCNKATYQDSTGTTEVWFALALATPNGPSGYHGLPGMILEVNKNDGEFIIAATEVKLASVDEGVFAKPKKGKKVTAEEFAEIVDEKMKEMGGVRKGGGTTFIIKQ